MIIGFEPLERSLRPLDLEAVDAPVWMAVSGASQAATVVVLEVCLVARAACRVGLLGSFLPLLGVESEVAGSR